MKRYLFIEQQVVLHYNNPGLARESAFEDAEIVMASLLPWTKIASNMLVPEDAFQLANIPLGNPMSEYEPYLEQ